MVAEALPKRWNCNRMRLIFDEERLAYSDAVAPLAFVQEVLRPRLARVRDLAAGPDVYSVEGVHDLRVASRRLRAAIRACAPLLADAAFTALQEIASTITQALGRPRELDVMIKMLEDEETRAVGAWKEAAREAGATLSARRLAAGGRCETAVALAQHIVLPRWGRRTSRRERPRRRTRGTTSRTGRVGS